MNSWMEEWIKSINNPYLVISVMNNFKSKKLTIRGCCLLFLLFHFLNAKKAVNVESPKPMANLRPRLRITTRMESVDQTVHDTRCSSRV